MGFESVHCKTGHTARKVKFAGEIVISKGPQVYHTSARVVGKPGRLSRSRFCGREKAGKQTCKQRRGGCVLFGYYVIKNWGMVVLMLATCVQGRAGPCNVPGLNDFWERSWFEGKVTARH